MVKNVLPLELLEAGREKVTPDAPGPYSLRGDYVVVLSTQQPMA